MVLYSSSVHPRALLTHLDVDIKELGNAAVQAHALTLVEVTFPVVGGNALLLARVGDAVEHVGNHLELLLGSSNLLRRRGLAGAHSKERHFEGGVEGGSDGS